MDQAILPFILLGAAIFGGTVAIICALEAITSYLKKYKAKKQLQAIKAQVISLKKNSVCVGIFENNKIVEYTNIPCDNTSDVRTGMILTV